MSNAGDENRRKAFADGAARAAMDLCCRAYVVSIHEMTLAGRSRAEAAYARQVAMYLAHVVGHLSIGEIGAAFDRDRSTVRHACHIIEDRRDSPVFDREIEALENAYRDRVKRLFAASLEKKGATEPLRLRA